MYGGTNDPSRHDGEVVFPDAEERVWSYDEQAGQYYLHHFYNHQPDLNLKNPRVRDEIAKLIAFWLQMGVSGFRVGRSGPLSADQRSLRGGAGKPARVTSGPSAPSCSPPG
jgi:glycosidase